MAKDGGRHSSNEWAEMKSLESCVRPCTWPHSGLLPEEYCGTDVRYDYFRESQKLLKVLVRKPAQWLAYGRELPPDCTIPRIRVARPNSNPHRGVPWVCALILCSRRSGDVSSQAIIIL